MSGKLVHPIRTYFYQFCHIYMKFKYFRIQMIAKWYDKREMNRFDMQFGVS